MLAVASPLPRAAAELALAHVGAARAAAVLCTEEDGDPVAAARAALEAPDAPVVADRAALDERLGRWQAVGVGVVLAGVAALAAVQA